MPEDIQTRVIVAASTALATVASLKFHRWSIPPAVICAVLAGVYSNYVIAFAGSVVVIVLAMGVLRACAQFDERQSAAAYEPPSVRPGNELDVIDADFIVSEVKDAKYVR